MKDSKLFNEAYVSLLIVKKVNVLVSISLKSVISSPEYGTVVLGERGIELLNLFPPIT